MTDGPICEHCGAPRMGGLVACTFCETPYPGVASGGVDCPQCHVDNDASRQTCARCGASLLRACIFCGHGTLFTAASCGTCGELFEGAEQRKRGREEEQRRQQMMGLAATGIGLLGQAARSPTGQGLLGQLMSELTDEIRKG